MRIGIDCRYLAEAPRGVGHYLLNILQQFANNEPKTIEFFLYTPKPIYYNPTQTNFVIRKGKIPLPGTWWFQTEGRNLINLDGLNSFWAPCDILPSGLAPYIYKVLSVHDLTHIFFPQTMANYNRLIHKLFFGASLLRADHIITMSNYTKQMITDIYKINAEKISVIYEGVDPKFRPYEDKETNAVLARYQINRPYILSVGTLEPKKNYSILLRAFKALKVDWNLVIIGKKGWKSQEVFSTIDELKIKERVKILGYIKNEDLPFFYNGAEIFVFPSLYEGFGLPLLEAMACGVPVICSNTSSLPEIGKDAVLYFNPYSVYELADLLIKLIGDAELQKTLRDKGIARAKEFLWQKTAQATLAILKGQSIE